MNPSHQYIFILTELQRMQSTFKVYVANISPYPAHAAHIGAYTNVGLIIYKSHVTDKKYKNSVYVIIF